jgi:glycosylphosphatidylinositol transamidase (GPIT) subunit GPI8
MDHSIGVYVIDRFTYYALEFLESVDQNSKRTIKDLVSIFTFSFFVLKVLIWNKIYIKKQVQLLSQAQVHFNSGVQDRLAWAQHQSNSSHRVFWQRALYTAHERLSRVHFFQHKRHI